MAVKAQAIEALAMNDSVFDVYKSKVSADFFNAMLAEKNRLFSTLEDPLDLFIDEKATRALVSNLVQSLSAMFCPLKIDVRAGSSRRPSGKHAALLNSSMFIFSQQSFRFQHEKYYNKEDTMRGLAMAAEFHSTVENRFLHNTMPSHSHIWQYHRVFYH